MTNIEFKKFWEGRQDSMNREINAAYYARKASEHIRVMDLFGHRIPAVDFGCGAGELLAKIAPDYGQPLEAVDFSASLVERASAMLAELPVTLSVNDALTHAASTAYPRWMSCGAVNQYSNEAQLRRFIAAFVDNRAARELFLFDTIDPIRIELARGRVIESYLRPRRPSVGAIRRIVRKLRATFKATRIALDGAYLHSLGTMGYGVKIAFWTDVCDAVDLTAVFLSSAEFEYRYHVIIRK